MSQLFKMTVRKKLISTFAIILLVPSIVIGTLSYQTAASKIQEQMLSNAQNNAELLNQMVDKIMDPEMKDIDYISQQINSIDYQGNDSPNVRLRLKEFGELHPEIINTYVGTQSGLMILEPEQTLPSGYDPRTRPWYTQALQSPNDVVITDPYVNATDKQVIVSIAKLTKDGTGVIGVDVDLKALGETVKGVKIGQTGFAFILDRNKNYLIHPTAKIGTVAKGDWVNAMYSHDKGLTNTVQNGQSQQVYDVKNDLTGWKIAATLYDADIQQQARTVLLHTAIVVGIAVVVGALLVWLIIRSIMTPLRRLIGVSEKIAQGDLTDRVQLKSDDEFGKLGASFDKMGDALRNMLREVSEASVQLAASSEQMTASAEQTAQATEHIAITVQELAVGTEKQVQSVDESSKAIEEMSVGVKQIAGTAHNVSSTANETSDLAKEGNQAIQQAVQQMESISITVNGLADAVKGLGERSQQIGEIVQVITDIAGQTNLLALNAAIEAARAGEHGRGFAVVADEVRRLAEQSSLSAQQIGELILAIQGETTSAVAAMETGVQEVDAGIKVVHVAGETFGHIQRSVQDVSLQIQEVSAAAQQLAVGTEQVVQAIQHISGVAEFASASTQNVSAASEEQLASMQEITASAQALSEMADHLQELLGTFRVE